MPIYEFFDTLHLRRLSFYLNLEPNEDELGQNKQCKDSLDRLVFVEGA